MDSSVDGVKGTISCFVFLVKNQHFIGSGFPFIITGPRYSKLNNCSLLTSLESNLKSEKNIVLIIIFLVEINDRNEV